MTKAEPPRRAGRAATRAPAPPRDQAESSFVPILRALVARFPGALAAALVDFEGETVDYAGGAIDPFDVKLAAAHFRVVLDDFAGCRSLGRPRGLVVRGGRRSFVVRPLPDGYALVILLRRRAGFTSSARAVDACEDALCREASWPLPRRLRWYLVRVVCDARKRPIEIGGAFPDGSPKRACAVDVLGALVGLAARERGFRVRLASGVEANVVRESGGFWYADEDL